MPITCRKLIRQAKAEHDDHFYGVDFNAFMDQLKRINDAPYYSSSGAGAKSVAFKERSVHINSIFDNILQPGSLWDGNDLTNRMTFFLRKRVQKLCTGTVSANKKPPSDEMILRERIFSIKDLHTLTGISGATGWTTIIPT